jgi:hypothetical protein
VVLGAALWAAPRVADAQLPIDPALLRPRFDSMVVLAQGNAVGSYTSRMTWADDGWHMTDQLAVGEFAQQRSEIVVDRAGRLRRVQLGGVTNGIQIRASLEYRRNRVKGVTVASTAGLLADSTAPIDTSQVRSISIVADTLLPPGTIDDNALLLYLPALPWIEGAHWTFPVFSGQLNTVRSVTFTVRGSASVALRSGTVDTWEVDVTGSASPTKYYITQASPHRLVRLEFTAVGLVFLSAQ